MNWIKEIAVALVIVFIPSHYARADSPIDERTDSNPPPSKRIEVYALSQNYWDTKSGETLGKIVQQLLPYNKAMQRRLMQDIIELNPDAFWNNNPDQMQANKRLWLPNNITKADTQVDQKQFDVQSFSWGNIKRPRR